MVLEVAGEQQQAETVPAATGRGRADATHAGVVLGAHPRAGWETTRKLVEVRYIWSHSRIVCDIEFKMFNIP